MGLLLLLTWVVFTLFVDNLTLKVGGKNFRYRITLILGLILTPQYPGSLLLLILLSSSFGVKITPQKNNSTVRSYISPTTGVIITP